MAHRESSLKGKELHTGEVSDRAQTQCSDSTKAWLSDVERTFDSSHKMWRVSYGVCIYRVPKPIMISKLEAYVPFVVSFGPYRHKIHPEVSRMDQHKLEAVHRMLARRKIKVTKLIEEIQTSEDKIRECYEEPIDLDGKTLSWILAMDACFILEFFKSLGLTKNERNQESFSLVFQTMDADNSMCSAIVGDIIKLENQIPLFILITLYELEFGNRKHAIKVLATLLSNVAEFRGFPFLSLSFESAKNKLQKLMENESPPRHLLDLCRMVIRDKLTGSSEESVTAVSGTDNINNNHEELGTAVSGTDNINNNHEDEELGTAVSGTDNINNNDEELGTAVSGTDNINNNHGQSERQKLKSSTRPSLSPTLSPNAIMSTPSAELLHKAGIKFQSGELKFESGRFGRSALLLPQITMWDNTETWLRNLMAYEECQRCSWSPEETVISNFVRLLQDLIVSEKDVSLLRKSLVINSLIGSDEDIARIFNRLGDGITFGSVQKFDEVKKAATEHYNSRWRVWWSQLKKDIFSQPWYILTLSSAILMLVMTAVQTVMTGIQTVYTVKN